MTNTFRTQVSALLDSGVNPRMSDAMLASLATMPSTPRGADPLGAALADIGVSIPVVAVSGEYTPQAKTELAFALGGPDAPSAPVCPIHGRNCEAWTR